MLMFGCSNGNSFDLNGNGEPWLIRAVAGNGQGWQQR